MNVVLVARMHFGGWAWEQVAPRLRAAGHRVYTPTLTGLGDRVHLAHAGIGLDTHVEDIVNLLRYEDLYEVVLVGWGYGGMVVTGAADCDPERVSRIAYLNGFVPRNGQAMAHLVPSAWHDMIREEQIVARGTPSAGFYMNPSEPFYRDLIADPQLRAWVAARTAPQPLRTFEQPLRLRRRTLASIPRSCIRGVIGEVGPMGAHLEQVADWFATVPGWEYLERPLTHFAPLTTPDQTAEALLEVIHPRPSDYADRVIERALRTEA